MFCTLLAVCAIAKADYVTLTVSPDNRTNSLVLVAGESANVVWTSGSFSYVYWTLQLPGASLGKTNGVGSAPSFHVAGPATLTLWYWASDAGSAIITINKSSPNPATVNVIPKGQGAVVTLQSTYDLNGEWTTLFSQAFINNTLTNQFFKFTMSVP